MATSTTTDFFPLLHTFYSLTVFLSALPRFNHICNFLILFLDAAIPISPINCNLNDKTQSSLAHNTAQLLATWLMRMLPFNTLKL